MAKNLEAQYLFAHKARTMDNKTRMKQVRYGIDITSLSKILHNKNYFARAEQKKDLDFF